MRWVYLSYNMNSSFQTRNPFGDLRSSRIILTAPGKASCRNFRQLLHLKPNLIE